MRKGTTVKSIRIPNDIIADIEETAKEKKTTFSKEVIRRLQNKGSDDKNYPFFLTKVQTLINYSLVGVQTGNEEIVKKAQEEAKKLWARM